MTSEEHCYTLTAATDRGEVKVDPIDVATDNVPEGGHTVGCHSTECGYCETGATFGLSECNIGVGCSVGPTKVTEEVTTKALESRTA